MQQTKSHAWKIPFVSNMAKLYCNMFYDLGGFGVLQNTNPPLKISYSWWYQI